MNISRLRAPRLWAVVALAALVVVLSANTSGAAGHGRLAGARVASTAAQWGFYSNGSGGPEGLLDWESKMGHKRFKFVGQYLQIGGVSNQPARIGRQAIARGATLYLNLSPFTGSGNNKTCIGGANGWADFAAGSEDRRYLAPWVKAFKSPRQYDHYRHIVLTFDHEPTADNGHHPSCGSSTDYRRAFTHIRSYFTSHGIKYPWAWTMVASSFIQNTDDAWQPQASKFRYVGVDFYSSDSNPASDKLSAAFSDAHSLGKQVIQGEFGAGPNRSDDQWFKDWSGWIAGRRHVGGRPALFAVDWNLGAGNDPGGAGLTLWVRKANSRQFAGSP